MIIPQLSSGIRETHDTRCQDGMPRGFYHRPRRLFADDDEMLSAFRWCMLRIPDRCVLSTCIQRGYLRILSLHSALVRSTVRSYLSPLIPHPSFILVHTYVRRYCYIRTSVPSHDILRVRTEVPLGYRSTVLGSQVLPPRSPFLGAKSLLGFRDDRCGGVESLRGLPRTVRSPTRPGGYLHTSFYRPQNCTIRTGVRGGRVSFMFRGTYPGCTDNNTQLLMRSTEVDGSYLSCRA